MKMFMLSLLLFGFTTIALAGNDYVVAGSQGIFKFVQVDRDKAADIDTYLLAIDNVCKPGADCQVIFWAENAPRRMPFTREQVRNRTAYWQYKKKSQSHRLYVDCDLFGNSDEWKCL